MIESNVMPNKKNRRPPYALITFPSADTNNGVLRMFQTHPSKAGYVPFPIRKVLVISGMKGKDARGAHTHHKTRQILLCLSGGCTVDLDDGTAKKSIRLSKPDQGLMLYPYVWHVMRNFKPNTLLLVIADRPYDEKEYIRDYEKFLSYARKRRPAK